MNGSITELDSSSPLFNSWSRCNTTILSWLTNSLSVELKASVMYINNAKDLWFNLKDRFSQGTTPRLFELEKEISHLSQGSLSVSSYFTKYKTFCGMSLPIISLLLFVLVLVLVDPKLLS